MDEEPEPWRGKRILKVTQVFPGGAATKTQADSQARVPAPSRNGLKEGPCEFPALPPTGNPRKGSLGSPQHPLSHILQASFSVFQTGARASRPLPAALSNGATESQPQRTNERVGLEKVSLPKFHCGGYNLGSES